MTNRRRASAQKRLTGGGGGSFAITTPILSEPTEFPPNIAGDYRPVFNIDWVDEMPLGGGPGDILLGRWGTSEAAAEALTPVEATVIEAWWLDGAEVFPDLGDYGETLSPGDTLHYQIKDTRGPLESDWSPFKTLAIVDGVMNDPGVANLTNQTGGQRVWSSSFTVAGMASGAYARLVGTGPIKVGTTVYEAGDEVQVQNGATVYWGVDTSATGGATVNNVIRNRHLPLTTFSATTIGGSADASAGPAPNAVNIGYVANYVDFSVTLEAATYALFVFGGFNDGAANVTIGGSSIAADYVDKSETGNNRIDAYVTTTSAGATTIRVSSNGGGNMDKVGIALAKLTGQAAGAPTVVKTAFGYSAMPQSLGSHTIPADGVAVVCAVSLGGSGGVTWANATELTENTAGAFPYSVAKMTSSATPSVNGASWGYSYSGGIGLIFDNA